MAQTLILRPSKDNSVQHTKSSGKTAFTLVSEKTADDDATYIYQVVPANSSAISKISAFRGKPDATFVKKQITKAELIVRAINTSTSSSSTSTLLSEIAFNNITETSAEQNVATTWTDYHFVFPVERLNNFISSSSKAPNIVLRVKTTGSNTGFKSSEFQIRITQIYLTLTYQSEVPVQDLFYFKEQGQWQQVGQAYQKTNGKWVQIDLGQVLGKLQNQTETKYIRGGKG